MHALYNSSSNSNFGRKMSKQPEHRTKLDGLRFGNVSLDAIVDVNQNN